MRLVPFPKIPHYRRDADAVHAVRRVVCLEKLDGANTRVYAPTTITSEHDVVIAGRTLAEGEPGFCQPALRAAFFADPSRTQRLASLAGDLAAELVLHGETCGRGIQASGFVYGSRPHFVLFAAQIGGAWLSLDGPLRVDGEDETVRELPSLRAVADALAITIAPRVYEGAPDPDAFDRLLEQPSTHAARRDAQQEGIVIWSDPLFLDGAGRPVFAKHKHPRRRESIDTGDTGDAAPDVEAFAERAVQLERLRHARQHLVESGRSPGDAAALARRVVQDVAREVPEYQQQLATAGKARVRAAIEARVASLLPQLDDEPG